MSAAEQTKKLGSLLRKLRAQHQALEPEPQPPATDGHEPLVHHLVYGLLLWEASTAQARAAMKRLTDAVVDFNELRICVSDEVATIIGEKYPIGPERALRIRFILSDLYNRRHAVSLAHLPELDKREARAFLESLEGVTPFAAARVMLMGGLGHAIPADERLVQLLVEEGVLEASATPESASSWLARHIPADEAVNSHMLLQAWSDEHGTPPKRKLVRQEPKAPATPAAPERKTKGRAAGKAEAELKTAVKVEAKADTKPGGKPSKAENPRKSERSARADKADRAEKPKRPKTDSKADKQA